MRRTFWSLMLTGIAVTALAGFSPTTQEAEAGLFSRLRAHFSGNCCTCSGEVVTCSAPVATCCPPAPTCACAAPCDACGCNPCGCEDSDDDCDDDCDD